MNSITRLGPSPLRSVTSCALALLLAVSPAACGPRNAEGAQGGEGSSGGAAITGWVPYSSAEHGFTVDAPGMLARTNEGSQPNGPPTVAYQIEVDPNFALRVQINDFGPELARVPPDQVFDGGVRGAVNSTGATLRTQRPLPLGSVPGRAFIADNPGRHYVVFGRMLLVGTRMYTLLAVVGSAQERQRADAVARFMDSFRLSAQ